MKPLRTLTAGQARRAIQDGSVAAEDLARSCLARIDERNGAIHAFEHLAPAADVLVQVGRGRTQGALGGLLVGLKDTIDTADLPTELGSPIHQGERPDADAACVSLLRRAGAAVAGKTATAELAYFHPAATRNPHDLDHTPGGSSGGSAAAVADGMVPIALGAQTAGSVIRPAAYCGVVGYVASHGELSLRGIQPLSPSLDSLGVICRSVEDVRLVRSVLLDTPLDVKACAAPPRIALAVPTSIPIDPEMVDATHDAAAQLASAGAQIEPIEISGPMAELIEHHLVVMAFEAARSLAYEAGFADRLSRHLLELIERGRRTTYATYCDALNAIPRTGAVVADRLGGASAILAPAAPGPAPRWSSGTGSPDLSRPWQALGVPSITVPACTSTGGLPLGVQLIGTRHGDDALLGIAGWVERRLSPSLRQEPLEIAAEGTAL